MVTKPNTPAAVSPATPFQVAEAHYRQMQVAINKPGSTDTDRKAFLEAVDLIDAAPTSSLEEFARSFIIAMDDGESLPIESTLDRLLADARRLVTSRFETLRLEYAELNTARHLSEEGCARSNAIEGLMANEPCESVADARAKLRFIADADKFGVRLDGEEAAQIATDAALYLAPEA
ncbi:hypothetical protein U1707_08605 [Sphingomonas sp. PB2P12]|uniref:hypothetical protein n=1 Tax=Sphingomonas sandaracina TaxID=3096157 RepID=UPI002FC93F49